MTALPLAAVAVLLAAALDWLVREPPERLDAIAWFGRTVGALDRDWSRPTAIGAVAALALPLAAAAVVGLVVAAASYAHPLAGAALAGLALFVATSLRSLLEEAHGVVAAAETDLNAARERLPALVGRDPAILGAAHVRSAALESGAENLARGLVAPLLAFALLAPVSLAAGAGAAAWITGLVTMDSVLGSAETRVGAPAARLDDVATWLPARVSAVLLTIAAGSPDPLLAARRWADEPASTNAGWPAGTLAGAVGVRLENPGAHTMNPLAPLPDADAARRGIGVVGRAGLLAYGLAALAGVIDPNVLV